MQSDAVFATDTDGDGLLVFPFLEAAFVSQVSVDQDSEDPTITFECDLDADTKIQFMVTPTDFELDCGDWSLAEAKQGYSDDLVPDNVAGFGSCVVFDLKQGENLMWTAPNSFLGKSGQASHLAVFSREGVGAKKIVQAYESLMASI